MAWTDLRDNKDKGQSMGITTSERVVRNLIEAGIISDNPKGIARVVIDLKAGEVAKVYVQYNGLSKLADILPKEFTK